MQVVYKTEMRTEAMPSRELLPGSNNLLRSVPGSLLVSIFSYSLNRFSVEILMAAGLDLVKAGLFKISAEQDISCYCNQQKTNVRE